MLLICRRFLGGISFFISDASVYNLSMPDLIPLEPVDYVVVGHLSCDLTPQGSRLGGTAAYSGLTARALGMRVGILTAFAGEIALNLPADIQICNQLTGHSATFENIYTPGGRQQVIHHTASDLHPDQFPQTWRTASVLHIGPIAQEGKAFVSMESKNSILGLTPQGWMRAWDGNGRIHPDAWKEADEMLPRAGAVVISLEDVGADEDLLEKMASQARILAVTEGPAGARLYWNGDLRRFHAPEKEELDATGAGDIFASAFFWRLFTTRDPWAAARFATHLASNSVQRKGLESIPTREEIEQCLVEVL